MNYAFTLERILCAIACAAVIVSILRECFDYANQRRAFNKAIGEFQYVQDRIVNMRASLEFSRAVAYRALWRFGRGENCSVEASIAKLVSADAVEKAAIDAIKIFGNRGYRRDFGFIERLCRSAIGAGILGGTAELQKITIWRRILDGLVW